MGALSATHLLTATQTLAILLYEGLAGQYYESVTNLYLQVCKNWTIF